MTQKKKPHTPQDALAAQTSEQTTPPDLLNNEISRLEKCEADLAAMTETAKRALADLQNFKRRSDEEKKSLAFFANVQIVLSLLPVIDNFRRAFTQTPQELRGNDWVEGIYRIEKQFTETLKNLGITEIAAIGTTVNPLHHEIVMEGPGEKDIVIEEFERGYLFQDKVLRPAKVKVGNGEQ